MSDPAPRACSVALADADLGLGNANWSKGLQAMSDWIWSGNLNPVAFPNNLGRYFLQIPAIFEQQLHYSTTLIFDEPSFRNGVQVSGFVERPVRELLINAIAHRRRSPYSMTHHAVLGTLTALKHGQPAEVFARKLIHLLDETPPSDMFTTVEREVLVFARAFATDPKLWRDEDCERLKAALRSDNEHRHPRTGAWMRRLEAARAAARGATAQGKDPNEAGRLARAAAAAHEPSLSPEENERLVNAQLVELAFIAVQFIALTGVFTSLAVPDEDFLPDVMKQLLSAEVIARIRELIAQGDNDIGALTPPAVDLPVEDILSGRVKVQPAEPRGSRLPIVSYEIDPIQGTRDKGIAVGGVQTGAYGWSFGSYFPGGLVYLLMHHPELARFEPPYSLPLLFNEDEWRNGTQTGGFVDRRLKELAYLRVYTLTRARYGLEHHTMFFYNLLLDEFGVGRPPNPPLSDAQAVRARKAAIEHADAMLLHVDKPAAAPKGVYTDLEAVLLAWVGRCVTNPHEGQEMEVRLRQELDADNRRQVENGVRELDRTPGVGGEAAFARLLDHQIAELAMLTGHMDGLGRAMTMLELESEKPVSRADGYLSDRPGLFDVYGYVGIGAAAITANELRLNPKLLTEVRERLQAGDERIEIDAAHAARTAEF